MVYFCRGFLCFAYWSLDFFIRQMQGGRGGAWDLENQKLLTEAQGKVILDVAGIEEAKEEVEN